MVTFDLESCKNKVVDSHRAAMFKLVGGPHHGNVVRMYAPYPAVKYADGSVYELHPPIAKTGEWVYVNDTNQG
jgi:hypothetical protein